jgi:quinol monooxygenase YgiN
VPTPTDDRRDLLTVIAHMRAAPGKRDELRAALEALEALIEPTSQGKGLRQLRPAPGHRGPRPVLLLRELGVRRRPGAHLDAPHLRDFAARIPELLDDSGLSVNRVRRIA